MGERGLEVYTSTAQMQVVGKRHYGRKAVTHGGGGGRERDRARDQFDSLLRWTARVRLDAGGNAELDVPMNDSLSSFRIVAVAHAGAQFFGTGKAVVNTTQDLILLSGLPPLVREGDRFAATFTVRNTTDHAVRVEATAGPARRASARPPGHSPGRPMGRPLQDPLGTRWGSRRAAPARGGPGPRCELAGGGAGGRVRVAVARERARSCQERHGTRSR
ncbi:MAG: alpha-2-macroglobulin family protein [Steroidobacteraceae bacterium]